MTMNNVTQSLSLDDARIRLCDAVSRLYDVDAALAMFKEAVEGESIEVQDGTLIDPTRPISMAQRELETIREQVNGALRAIERDLERGITRPAIKSATTPHRASKPRHAKTDKAT